MSKTSKKVNTSLFNNPMETFPGLTINDLNRYLPALRTIKDVEMDAQNMKEGMFLANCLDGLRKLPDNSIDLIISNQSLEHISDIRNNLDLIEQKLSLGGLTYITVPDASKETKILKKGAFQPLEHINSFTSKSRDYLFSDNMKYKFMIKNLRKGSGTIWLFKKVKNIKYS